MSTATPTLTTTPTARGRSPLGRLTFPGVLRSEWIKLRTLRSTAWTAFIVLVLLVGLPFLVSAFARDASALEGAPADTLRQFVINQASSGITFASLAIAVLGVLAISGEFSTGMIRSSFAAVPNRIRLLTAKACVLFVSSFVLSAIGFMAAWVTVAVVLGSKGYEVDLFSSSTLLSVAGSASFIGLVSLFALGLGTVLKASAGGIATALGALFLLPVISSLLQQLLPDQTWIADWSRHLLSNVGPGMAGIANQLEPWQNILTVVIWAAVPLVSGAILLKRRDA
ncbi:ABC transporter permease [Leifsonia sp. McL0607]|uniref:ABC transporter permease n=1 Tax=Leifsonia sp. McL0607 TaxID=3415672 RepID=UPI003CF29AD8